MPGSTRVSPLVPWTFLLPVLVFYALFLVFPVAFSFDVSLHNWNMLTPLSTSPYMGVAQYTGLLEDSVFVAALKHNFLLWIMGVPLLVGIGLILALALEAVRTQTVLRYLLFLPAALSPVAIGISWVYLLSGVGPVNAVLQLLGMASQPFLSSPGEALWVILGVYVWSTVGLAMLVLVAGLKSIPVSLLEAATMDGATGGRRFRHITLPVIKPSLLFLTVTNTIAVWQLFDLIAGMTTASTGGEGAMGGPINATQTVATYMYQVAFQDLNMGKASAMAFALLIVLAAVTLVQVLLFRRGGLEVN